ncbi:hypothetical protein D3C71_1863840 [compost metagenome]
MQLALIRLAAQKKLATREFCYQKMGARQPGSFYSFVALHEWTEGPFGMCSLKELWIEVDWVVGSLAAP